MRDPGDYLRTRRTRIIGGDCARHWLAAIWAKLSESLSQALIDTYRRFRSHGTRASTTKQRLIASGFSDQRNTTWPFGGELVKIEGEQRIGILKEDCGLGSEPSSKCAVLVRGHICG